MRLLQQEPSRNPSIYSILQFIWPKDYMIAIVSGLPRSGSISHDANARCGWYDGSLPMASAAPTSTTPWDISSGNSSSNSPKIPRLSRWAEGQSCQSNFPDSCFRCRSPFHQHRIMFMQRPLAEVLMKSAGRNVKASRRSRSRCRSGRNYASVSDSFVDEVNTWLNGKPKSSQCFACTLSQLIKRRKRYR